MRLNEFVINSRELRSAIIGMILGDAYVYMGKNKKGEYCGDAKFRLKHCAAQKEYLEEKGLILKKKSGIIFKVINDNTFLEKTQKTYETYLGYTNNNRYATFFRRIFYPTPVKIINRKILDSLTDLGLFIWYLDDGTLNPIKRLKDGSIKAYRIFLATNCFTLEEVKIIQSWFESKYNIRPNINRTGNGYKLYFNSSKTRMFMEIIDKFYNSVPCMNYKFLKHHFQ